jgi:hypothetical protein
MAFDTFNKLEKASRKEIVQEVNVQLEELNSMIAEFRKPHRAVYAQLLLQELAAREQRWQSRIMVVCTIIITVLTVVITWATILQLNHGN